MTGAEAEDMFDAIKDAVALIRCCAEQDGKGTVAIVTASENPRYLAAMTATAAVVICRRGGLDDNEAVSALLGTVLEELTDRLLNEARSGGGSDLGHE